jgi:hypothetical protein
LNRRERSVHLDSFRVRFVEDRRFQVLLQEYSQLREDERTYLGSSLTLVTIIISVVAAVTAAFVISSTPRSAVPTIVFVLAPLLPLGVFGFVAANAVSASYRVSYLCAVEAALFAAAGSPVVDGWPLPSYATGWRAINWTSGLMNRVWNVVDLAAMSIFVALVVGPVVLVSGAGWKVAMGVLYVGPTAMVVTVYVAAYTGERAPQWVKRRVRDVLLSSSLQPQTSEST